jgi:hypothetical protein
MCVIQNAIFLLINLLLVQLIQAHVTILSPLELIKKFERK